MKEYIDIGTKIHLQNLIETRMLIQSNSGGGKSLLARAIIEAVMGVIPVIVFDRDGEYYTLKEVNGDILVIGGDFADIPLSVSSVKLLVPEIIGKKLSVVIDLSNLENQQKREYVKAFIDAMMQLGKSYWHPYLVFIEEAHFFAGEQDKYVSGPAVKELMSSGRKKGFCGVPITQRIAKLHKDVAAECNNKFIGRTFMDIDVERAGKELGFAKASDRLKLRELQPGEFYVMGTSITPHHPHVVTIRKPISHHPKAGSISDIKLKKPTERIIKMLEKLSELQSDDSVKDVPVHYETAAASDPELEIKLSNAEAKIEHLQAIINDQHIVAQEYQKRFSSVKDLVRKVVSPLTEVSSSFDALSLLLESDMSVTEIVELPQPVLRTAAAITTPKRTAQPVQPGEKKQIDKTKNSPGELRMLAAAKLYHPKPVNVVRMAFIAGMAPKSGTFGEYLSRLARKGFITRSGKECSLTREGFQIVKDAPKLPTTRNELIEFWCNEIGANNGATRILRFVSKYPKGVAKSLVAQQTGMTVGSGTFGEYLSRLRRVGIIKVEGVNVFISEELMI